MRDIANILQHAGFIVYALPILWCTFKMHQLKEQSGLVRPLRTFRRMGPVLGLSLGACILGVLAGQWLDHQAFELHWSTDSDRVESAMYITFFAIWVSNIKLEIWTLEPLRKIDNATSLYPESMDAFHSAAAPVRAHLLLHTIGILSIIILRTGF